MATDYTLKMKADLDTSEAEAKIQALQKSAAPGSSGGSSNSLENSITKLNNTLDKMNKDGGVQMKNVMRMFAGGIIGNALMKQATQQVESGNTGVGVGMGAFGGAMRGAMSMAAFGPIGMAAGAAFEGLNSALQLLQKSAEKTNTELMKQVRLQ